MLDKYAENYYRTHCGPIPYTPEAVEWKEFFSSVANNIIDNLSIKSSLEIGCAFGHLVKELNDLGVDAVGYEISKYALEKSLIPSKVHNKSILEIEEIAPKELVICIEVVEHLMPEDAENAIKNLCLLSYRYILFSSSPDDFDEPTHHNVRSEDYWLKLFNSNNFHKIKKAEWLSKQAIILEKG